MRPIVRGPWPQSGGGDGKDIAFHKYVEARAELIKRIGEYCSFCEMHLDASLAVEHVKPKKPKGATSELADRLLDWHNFLLACANCNAIKSNQEIELSRFFWPDLDNTFAVLSYLEGGRVTVADDLTGDALQRAENTIKLTGLDRLPVNDPKASDRRWQNRREAWDMAIESRHDLASCDIPQMRRQILKTAKAQGYWSVWMTVFADDVLMRRELIDAFAGTCRACFDEDCQAISRPGSEID